MEDAALAIPKSVTFDFSVCGNNNVLRLYVTVNDPVIMRRFQSHGNLDSNASSLFNRQLSFFSDIFFQRNAFNELHHNIIDALVIAHIEYVDNMRDASDRPPPGPHCGIS